MDIDDLPLLFFSGMAADERLFKAQAAAFPQLRVVAWTPAQRGEALRAYAERLAPRIDPGRPCFVGGASFGGVVALEVATLLPALGCILIGSVRSPAGIPRRWRVLRPLAAIGPDALGSIAGLGLRVGRPVMTPRLARQLEKLASPEAAFVRWATCALLGWQPSPAVQRVRTFQIHGAADRVFPVALSRAQTVVPGGGHALSVFFAAAVNEFISAAVKAATDI